MDNYNWVVFIICDVVKKNGVKMVDLGFVFFNFKSVGVIYVKVDKVEVDDLLFVVMDVGVEDVVEFLFDDEDDEEDDEK